MTLPGQCLEGTVMVMGSGLFAGAKPRNDGMRLYPATLTPRRFGPARQASIRMTPEAVAIMPAALTLEDMPTQSGPQAASP